MKKRRLHYHLALPVTAIIVVLLLVNIALSSSLQRKQAEDTMRDQAYILSQNMSAIWDFISVNQSRINYDRDGVYNQKGLYCSKAGLSVGALFSKRTDYIISYAALNPRSEQNRADDFETEALVAFADDPSLEEYTAFGKVRAEEGYFRYAAPLRMDGTCESCHGGIAGEIDETGYPKEGFVDGDLVGIISIATPLDSSSRTTSKMRCCRAYSSWCCRRDAYWLATGSPRNTYQSRWVSWNVQSNDPAPIDRTSG